MSWYCAQGADCCSPHTDGKGGHTLTSWVEIELAKTFARMFGVPFEDSEPNKGDPPPHGLCGWCWEKQNGPPEKGVTNEPVEGRSGSPATQRDVTPAPGVDRGREASAGAPRRNGPARPPESVAATATSWAFEARSAYLERRLKYAPWAGPSLVEQGLWTGDYDAEGRPVPSEVAFHSGLWQREVWPVYDSPEPVLNKMRSLRDTLILSPEAGPHLISAGLWTGEYDAQGLPIPTPTPIDNRRCR